MMFAKCVHIAYISKINYTILSKGLTITEGVPHLLKLYQMFNFLLHV